MKCNKNTGSRPSAGNLGNVYHQSVASDIPGPRTPGTRGHTAHAMPRQHRPGTRAITQFPALTSCLANVCGQIVWGAA